MVAVAIQAVMNGRSLTKEDKEVIDSPWCSGQLGELDKKELASVKKAITVALRYIKSYNRPSRIWFSYQNSLAEGCNRLSVIVSPLPISAPTTKLLINMLLRLDKKLSIGGVDDFDGTVGSFMYETVEILKKYAKLDSKCIKEFEKLCKQETCFEWEEELVRMFDEQ